MASVLFVVLVALVVISFILVAIVKAKDRRLKADRQHLHIISVDTGYCRCGVAGSKLANVDRGSDERTK